MVRSETFHLVDDRFDGPDVLRVLGDGAVAGEFSHTRDGENCFARPSRPVGKIAPRTFLRRHRGDLAGLPFAVFAMGPRTLSEEDVDGSRRQLAAALAKDPTLEPFATAIFGGVLDPSKQRFPFSRIPASDARDWNAIRAWGDEVAARFALIDAVA